MANDEKTYRVDVRDRALTAAESERVAAEVRAAEPPPKEKSASFWIREPWARRVVLAAAGALVWKESGLLAFSVLGLVAIETFLTLRGERKRARQKLERAAGPMRGPWDPPPRGWSVRETHVVARSVVRAASGDEEIESWTWLLFEVPGGEWFYMRVPEVPRRHRAETFARSDLLLTRLWPRGPALDVAARGASLPVVGAPDYPFDDPPPGEAERRWEPSARWADELGRLRHEDDGLVREGDLPPWLLSAVGRDRES